MTSNEVKAINDLCEAVDKWDGNYSTLEGVERLEALYMKRLDWRDAGLPRVPEVPSVHCPHPTIPDAEWCHDFCGHSTREYCDAHGVTAPSVPVPSAEALETAVAILCTWAVEHEQEHARLGSHAREVRDWLRATKRKVR
jgi:hypothetical protein